MSIEKSVEYIYMNALVYSYVYDARKVFEYILKNISPKDEEVMKEVER